MTGRLAIGWLAVLAACGARRAEPQAADAAGSSAAAAAVAPRITAANDHDPAACPDSDWPAAAAAAPAADVAACLADLERTGRELLRLPSRRWPDPALQALSRCSVLPSALRAGARAAVGADPDHRASILMEQARPFLPRACLIDDPTLKGDRMPACCRPPGDLPGAGSIPALDAGTWLFSAAVWRALEAARGSGPGARRVLDELWQGAALQRSEPVTD